MCMSDDRKDAKNSKGDEDMGYALKNAYKQNHTPKNITISNNIAKKLMQGKPTVVVKDGEAKINENHPDYKFWMED